MTMLRAALMLAGTIGTVAAQGPLPDPTRPAQWGQLPAVVDATGPEAVVWRLTGVRIGVASRRAIINGRSVREGERLGAMTVLEVRPTAVVLQQQDGRRIVVSLLQHDIKRAVQP